MSDLCILSISLCKWVPHLDEYLIHMEVKYTHSAPFSPMLCGSHGMPHSDLLSGELPWGCSWWRAFSCHISRYVVAFSPRSCSPGTAPSQRLNPVPSHPCPGWGSSEEQFLFWGLNGLGWDFSSIFSLSLLLSSPLSAHLSFYRCQTSNVVWGLSLSTPSHLLPSQVFPLNKWFRV